MNMLELLAATVNRLAGDVDDAEFEAALVSQAALGAAWAASTLGGVEEIEAEEPNDVRGWPTHLLVPVDEKEDEAALSALGIKPGAAAAMYEMALSLDVFCDNGIPTFLWPNRPCRHCGETPTVHRGEGSSAFWSFDDPCIADLPGVRSACCGHARPPLGQYPRPYVLPDSGTVLRGAEALEMMRGLGGRPPG